MTDKGSESDTHLGFVDVLVYEDGAIRGGILVTDMETRPYEFLVTTPVKPSQIQRVLYGSTLSEHLFGELIGLPLVQKAQETLSLVIVRNPNLMIMRPRTAVPVILVGQEDARAAEGQVNQAPVVFKAHPNYVADINIANTTLTDLAQRRDLLEPFARLKAALIEVHKQKMGD